MEEDNEKFIKDEEKEKEAINEIKENNKIQNEEDENSNLFSKNYKDNEIKIGLKNENNDNDNNNLNNNLKDNIENNIKDDNIDDDKKALINKDNDNNENRIKKDNNIENNENNLIIGDYIIIIQYTKLLHIPYFKFGNMINFYCPYYKFKSKEINLSQMPTPPFGIVATQCKI